MGNKHSLQKSGLTDKEIAVLKANSNHSVQELRELYDKFKEECPSGRMNKSQFKKYFQSIAGHKDKYGDGADFFFSMFDKNGDGSVDFSEFVLSCGMFSKGDIDSELDLAFTLIDSSGDGSISFQEMVNFMSYGNKFCENDGEYDDDNSNEMAASIFAMFGANKEQKLSKKQFMQGVKNNKTLTKMFGIK